MRSKRMLMGAALIGCVAATMIPGAYAQEANTTDQFNARASGQQPSTAGQPRPSMRQDQGAGMNAQKQGAGMNAQGQAADMNARSNTRTSNRASASGQVERRGFANEGATKRGDNSTVRYEPL
jgi:hypothetical protein